MIFTSLIVKVLFIHNKVLQWSVSPQSTGKDYLCQSFVNAMLFCMNENQMGIQISYHNEALISQW